VVHKTQPDNYGSVFVCSFFVDSFYFKKNNIKFDYNDFEVELVGKGFTVNKYVGSATEVNIPSHILFFPVIRIGKNAFSRCTSLKSVTIPDNVTSIGDNAFYHCDSLTSVTIGSGVISIRDEAFYYCDSLTSVTFRAGSNISGSNFSDKAFPARKGLTGNGLKIAYSAGKAGTYTRARNGVTWRKVS